MSQINRMTACKVAVLAVVSLAMVMVMNTHEAFAQAFGVELQGSLMPASGGMGGTGIAQTPGCANTTGAQSGNPVTVQGYAIQLQRSLGGTDHQPGEQCHSATG